ncbi:MAG: hypothetical protein ACEQSN_12370, partial [Yersinia sp. (in: enterobacteria)]
LQDVRLFPTRYINVSLFGKKNKPYVSPIQDSVYVGPMKLIGGGITLAGVILAQRLRTPLRRSAAQ